MKFTYFNDTNRVVNIHPATFLHGCTGNDAPIQPLEERTLTMPVGSHPWVKMWDYEDQGLSILISPRVERMNLETGTAEVDNGDDFWKEVLEKIAVQITKASYDTWFKSSRGQVVEDTLIIYCQNEFQRDWLKNQYEDLISLIVKDLTEEEIHISIFMDGENSNSV